MVLGTCVAGGAWPPGIGLLGFWATYSYWCEKHHAKHSESSDSRCRYCSLAARAYGSSTRDFG